MCIGDHEADDILVEVKILGDKNFNFFSPRRSMSLGLGASLRSFSLARAPDSGERRQDGFVQLCFSCGLCQIIIYSNFFELFAPHGLVTR